LLELSPEETQSLRRGAALSFFRVIPLCGINIWRCGERWTGAEAEPREPTTYRIPHHAMRGGECDPLVIRSVCVDVGSVAL
jgi:hypothetical protein